jgi:hypothetical protein
VLEVTETADEVVVRIETLVGVVGLFGVRHPG